MKTICPLNQLISTPPWTLWEKKPQTKNNRPNNLIANHVLSLPSLPNYSLRPLTFKNGLKPIKLFCHEETITELLISKDNWDFVLEKSGKQT